MVTPAPYICEGMLDLRELIVNRIVAARDRYEPIWCDTNDGYQLIVSDFSYCKDSLYEEKFWQDV